MGIMRAMAYPKSGCSANPRMKTSIVIGLVRMSIWRRTTSSTSRAMLRVNIINMDWRKEGYKEGHVSIGIGGDKHTLMKRLPAGVLMCPMIGHCAGRKVKGITQGGGSANKEKESQGWHRVAVFDLQNEQNTYRVVGEVSVGF